MQILFLVTLISFSIPAKKTERTLFFAFLFYLLLSLFTVYPYCSLFPFPEDGFLSSTFNFIPTASLR